ncbi:MAG: SspB family protein [Rhodothalassiaceae bacterium]
MADPAIRYDELVQDALRGVVRTVLERVARGGLPGDHHFYIAFRSDAPGVRIPSHLKKRYPDEMTIVLQHRFWDLEVDEERFSVGLSFGGKAETLSVPFAAITGFVDPSVQFALQFAGRAAAPTQAPQGATGGEAAETPREAPVEDKSSPPDAAPGGAEVVTLDRFRKKT